MKMQLIAATAALSLVSNAMAATLTTQDGTPVGTSHQATVGVQGEASTMEVLTPAKPVVAKKPVHHTPVKKTVHKKTVKKAAPKAKVKAKAKTELPAPAASEPVETPVIQ